MTEKTDPRMQVAPRRPYGTERHVKVVQDSFTSTGEMLRKVSRGVWTLAMAGESLLLFRFLLRLLEANPNNLFARLVFRLSDVLMIPFEGLVRNPSFDGIVLDAEAVIAALVYLLVTWLFVEAIWVVFYGKRRKEVIIEEERR
ncbi:MAG: YggT family protein [Chloroflexi bacterium]|nr:YggT family protein [Chloroflexota bacterium]